MTGFALTVQRRTAAEQPPARRLETRQSFALPKLWAATSWALPAAIAFYRLGTVIPSCRAAYLVAMNGDPRKPKIAAAQTLRRLVRLRDVLDCATGGRSAARVSRDLASRRIHTRTRATLILWTPLGYPTLDILGQPDVPHLESRYRLGKVPAVGDLVDALARHTAEHDSDLRRAHQPQSLRHVPKLGSRELVVCQLSAGLLITRPSRLPLIHD